MVKWNKIYRMLSLSVQDQKTKTYKYEQRLNQGCHTDNNSELVNKEKND